MRTEIRIRILALLALLVTIGCDRVTKYVAVRTLAGTPGRSFLADIVRISYVENSGGFLGLGASLPAGIRTGLFTIGTGLLLISLAYVTIRNRSSGWTLFALTIFIAGGASNWIDRVARGSVVDFMNLGLGPVRTGVFNVADVAVTLGVVILLLGQIPRNRNRKPARIDPGGTTGMVEKDA
jgi:signal peptidase II